MSLFHYYEQKDDVMRVNMSWIFFVSDSDEYSIKWINMMMIWRLRWRLIWHVFIDGELSGLIFLQYTIEVREDEMRRHQKLEIIIVNS